MKETLQFTPVRMAEQFMESYRNHELYPTWHYENGCLLKALEELYTHTGEQKYFDYIRELMDNFIQEDGSIRSYTVEEYNLDQINQGKSLFLLLDKTGEEKYRKAADLLMVQLKGQPRTSEGGFWHKKVYPFQMWLDGLYMATPFLTQYGAATGEEKWFDRATLQLLLVEKRTRDPRSGLLYHAWDESKEQRWSSGETGCSPHVWSRAMGWYVMAIVDTLDHLPVDHEQRGQIVGIFERVANALVHVQDQQSGLWPHLLDQPGRERNYLEASGTSMFVYALAKGVRKGYLSGKFKAIAEKGYQGLLQHLLQTDREGVLSLTQCNGGAGLGGTPYRDGSYEYYVTESIRINDPKSVAPFILAGVEIELYKPN